jgi:hypothetical protein
MFRLTKTVEKTHQTTSIMLKQLSMNLYGLLGGACLRDGGMHLKLKCDSEFEEKYSPGSGILFHIAGSEINKNTMAICEEVVHG